VGHDYSIFEDLNFEVYFTVTFCDDFKLRDFDLITRLNSQDDNLFLVNMRGIKDKIINTIKNSIFLNIYEYYHLKNAMDFIKEKFADKKILLFVDSPQCQDRHWKELFSEITCSFKPNIVHNSEDIAGIQFADVLAGTMENILEKVDKNSNLNSFEKKVVLNFSQGNGKIDKIFLNNPQIVMWDEKYEPLVMKINELIDKIQNEN